MLSLPIFKTQIILALLYASVFHITLKMNKRQPVSMFSVGSDRFHLLTDEWKYSKPLNYVIKCPQKMLHSSKFKITQWEVCNRRDPILCNFWIPFMYQKHEINNQYSHKIGSLLSKSGLAIQFNSFDICFTNHNSNFKWPGTRQAQTKHRELNKRKESSSKNFLNYYHATCPNKNTFKNSHDEMFGKCHRFCNQSKKL